MYEIITTQFLPIYPIPSTNVSVRVTTVISLPPFNVDSLICYYRSGGGIYNISSIIMITTIIISIVLFLIDHLKKNKNKNT